MNEPDGWAEIERHAEETECYGCGFPLYLGDRVFWADTVPFCGRGCANEHLDRLLDRGVYSNEPESVSAPEEEDTE